MFISSYCAKECAPGGIMSTGLLLDSAVPSNNAVKLYVLIYGFKSRGFVSFQITPNFLSLLFSGGKLKKNQ